MTKILFVDLDGVVVKPGTHDVLPGVEDTLRAWVEGGWELCFFTCWAMSRADRQFLYSLAARVGCNGRWSMLRKPCADQYGYFDDRLVVADTKVPGYTEIKEDHGKEA